MTNLVAPIGATPARLTARDQRLLAGLLGVPWGLSAAILVAAGELAYCGFFALSLVGLALEGPLRRLIARADSPEQVVAFLDRAGHALLALLVVAAIVGLVVLAVG